MTKCILWDQIYNDWDKKYNIKKKGPKPKK